MTASRPVTRWGLGVLLAALAIGVAAAPPAEAAPDAPRQPSCDLGGEAHLYRSRYTLPRRLPADVDFDDYGFRFNPRAPEDWLYACSGDAQIPPRDSRVDDRYVVLYRQQAGGEWVLERDGLRTAADGHIPEGQCLDVVPGAAGNGSAATQPDIPERLPLEDLDAHASLQIFDESEYDGGGGPPYERFCRQGSEWVAEWATGGEQPGNVVEGVTYPEGHHREWAEECMSFLAGDYPTWMNQRNGRTITSPNRPDDGYVEDVHVIIRRMIDEEGEDAARRWIRGGLAVSDIRGSVTYCRQGDTWFRIDDYDLMAELQERYRTVPRLDCEVDDDIVETTFMFIPNACWGRFPTQNYDLSHDMTPNGEGLLTVLPPCWVADCDRANPTNWNPVRHFLALMMRILFFFTKAFVAIALFLMEWAFTYDFTQWYSHVIDFGERYKVDVVEELALYDIAWFVLLVWAGLTALAGRAGKATGEIAMSMVMWGLALVLLMNTETYTDYLRSGMTAMDEMSLVVLAAASGQDEISGTDLGSDQETRNANARQIIEPLQAGLHRAFIEDPYDYLQWGRHIPEGDPCAETRDYILQQGLDMDWKARQDMMSNAGCKRETAHHALATEGRTFGTFVSAAVASFVFYAITVLAIGIIIAKYILAFLFIIAPIVAVLAILPSGGRRLAFLWMSTVVQMMVTVVLLAFFLSFILLGTDIVVKTTSPDNMAERWTLLMVVFLTAMSIRRSLMEGTRNLVGAMTGGLQRLTPAGRQAAERRPDGPAGYDFNRGIDRTVGGAERAAHTGIVAGAIVGSAAAGMVSGAIGSGVGTVGRRVGERRVAYRNYRNLEKIQHSIRGNDFELGRLPLGVGGGGGGGARPVAGTRGRRPGTRGRGPNPVPLDLPTRNRPFISWRHLARPRTFLSESRMFHPVRTHRENSAVRRHLRQVEHMHVPTVWEHISHPIRTRNDLRAHKTALRARQGRSPYRRPAAVPQPIRRAYRQWRRRP